jgi:hypothetical protein
MLDQNNAGGTPGKLKGQPSAYPVKFMGFSSTHIGRSEIRQKRKPLERVANFTFLRGWAKIANCGSDPIRSDLMGNCLTEFSAVPAYNPNFAF